MNLIAIAAVAQNWGIGLNNQLLFHLPEDMRQFKALTTGNTVIMGRKTLEALPGGKPLPNRRNIVMSRTVSDSTDGVLLAHSIAELLPLLTETNYVIGGGEIYSLLLPYCSEAILTLVESNPKADTFFPDLDLFPNWILTEQSPPYLHQGLTHHFSRWINHNPKQL